MNKPNYQGGSTINLMSSISHALGQKSPYKELKLLPAKDLKDSKNIVLIVIDGLGYEYLKKHGKSTALKKHLNGKITSTFPSSTSAAMTGFYTGLSPKEHGMTGWYIYLKELKKTIISLPFLNKEKKSPLPRKIKIDKIFNLIPFTNKIKANSYYILPKPILNSKFTKASSGKAKRSSFKSLTGMIKELKRIIKIKKKKKFIMAYWPEYDTLAHDIGIKNKKVLKHFKTLEKKLSTFLKSSKEKNTTIIITADHGQIQVPKKKIINLFNHPKLKETFSIPPTGEARFKYIHLKPKKEKQFKNYIKKNLSHVCTIHKSKDLIKKNFFGLGKSHPQLKNRIGNYTIIMKDNYAMRDYPSKDIGPYNIGDHGSLSKEELFVPLIVLKN